MPMPKDPIKAKLAIERMRAAHKGKPCPESAKRKLSACQTGRTRSEETREKMGSPKRGIPLSEEMKKKLSESQSGSKHRLFGKHQPEETRRRIAESHKGIPRPDWVREKLSLANMGKKHTQEQIEKIRAANSREKNYLWKGGVSFAPYCPKFNNEFKERVRGFFKYTCQVCGRVWKQGERRLSVHHVNYQKDSCCNENVIPLFVPVCAKCHLPTNNKRDYWESTFTELIMTKYGGQCYLPKQLFLI
jgi:hypothetical protein